jgi:hypothetical protein
MWSLVNLCNGPDDVLFEIIEPKYNVLNFLQKVITQGDFQDISMALWLIGNIAGDNLVAAKHLLDTVSIIDHMD